MVLAFKHLGFNCHLDFDICVWLRAGLVPARIVPAHEAEMNSATTCYIPALVNPYWQAMSSHLR